MRTKKCKNPMLINLVLGCAVCFITCCFTNSVPIGGIAGVLSGIIREYIEDRKYANFDIENIVSSLLGSVIGFILYTIWLINRLYSVATQ